MILNTKSYDYLLNVPDILIFLDERIYKDSWLYRIELAFFGLIVAFLHNIIAKCIKLQAVEQQLFRDF